MSTEAQRARNARKRAKLKAHRREGSGEPEPTTSYYMWEFAVRGVKSGFDSEQEEFAVGDPVMPNWVHHCDYISHGVVAPGDADLDQLKAQVRSELEEQIGISRWDQQVRLINRFWLS